MRIFSNTENPRWGYWGKINFIDENDVLVGYDFSGNCCENFGYILSATEPKSAQVSGNIINERSVWAAKLLRKDAYE